MKETLCFREGMIENCKHDWEWGEGVFLTNPPQRHRECLKCNRKECKQVTGINDDVILNKD